MNQELVAYSLEREQEYSGIPPGRIKMLQASGDYIISKIGKGMKANLIFICTHNSRRSQFAQLWAYIASGYFELQNITCFSGGTETTAFNSAAVRAAKRAGCILESASGPVANPVYYLETGEQGEPLVMWSKKYDDPANHAKDFAALMVCSQADENCPFIPGADSRISLHYEDPKIYDGTSMESMKYDQSCREIARDQFYLFKYVRDRS